MQIASNERKKNLITFSVLLLVTAGLVLLLLTSLYGGREGAVISAGNESDNKLVSEQQLAAGYNLLLLDKMKILGQQDSAFAATITNGDMKLASQKIALIRQLEMELVNVMDSVAMAGSQLSNDEVRTQFKKMIDGYRVQAEDRQALSSMRNALIMNRDGFSTDEKAMLKLQDELAMKSSRIAAIESALKLANAQKAAAIKNSRGNDDNAGELRQQVASLENKIASLTATNTAFRQDNERLAKLQAETASAVAKPSSNELALKEKNFAQQQKIEALNAEMQLLRVDCNLNRVDATQIISTARQRKLLLTEASTILTSLNSTGNDEIRRKVKDKIDRLNSVAANSRD